MRLWPVTLVGRTVAVVLIGVVVSNLIGLAVFMRERSDLLMGARGRALAERVAVATDWLEETPAAGRTHLPRGLRGPGFRFSWSPRPWVTEETHDWRIALIRDAILSEAGIQDAARLHLGLRRPGVNEPDPQLFSSGRRRFRFPPPPDGNGPGRLHQADLLVGSLALPDGTWLNFAAFLAPVHPIWASRFFIVILGVTAVALATTAWAVRRASRPLTMLSAAAERLGLDVDAPSLAEEGPREVQTASRAFNTMQHRLQRFVRDRTQMLAAISHDLRTPITRLKLRAEFVEDEEQRRKMLGDLDDMEAMIAATLAFARDDPARERPQPLDLGALLEAVCSDVCDAGRDARYEGPARIPFNGRPAALKRAFANLVDNAVKYGTGAVVAADLSDSKVSVTVDDNGPGLADADRDRVFEPFVRADTSRSRETGGVGLGLAIVRAAVRAHAGEVKLANRSEGGLRVTVTLPTGG